MTTKRAENLPKEKRSALIDAARFEFAHHGFEGASLNSILKTAGFSKGQFYYYFEDKADLYGVMLTEAFGPFFDDFDIMCDTDSPKSYWARLESVIGEMAASITGQPELLKLAMGFHQLISLPERPLALTTLVDRSHDFAVMLVSHGRRVGAITTDIPDDLLSGILDGMHEKLDHWSFFHADRITIDAIELHARLYVGLFRSIAELHVSMKSGGKK